MRISVITTAIFTVAIASGSISLAADAQDIGQKISGDWMGCYVSRSKPKTISTITLMKLSVDGSTITGTMQSNGHDLPLQGDIESGRVFFTRTGQTKSGEVLTDRFVGLSLKENASGLTLNGKVETGTFTSRSGGSANEAWFLKIKDGAEAPACPL